MSAQERFIRTFIARARPCDTVSPAILTGPSPGGERSRWCPDHLADPCQQCYPSPSCQSNLPAPLLHDLFAISTSSDPQLMKCPVARFLVPLLSNATTSMGEDAVAGLGPPTTMSQSVVMPSPQTSDTYARANRCGSVLPFTPSQTVQPFLVPFLNDDEPSFGAVRPMYPTTGSLGPSNSAAAQGNPLQVTDYTSDGTTACQIAASLITTNNAIGYSTEELESRLRIGYRATGIANEDCRILNKVLFAVLAEISWVPGDDTASS